MSQQYNIKEIWCNNNGKRIYGQAYIPKNKDKVPLIIFSHELCATHFREIPYAQEFAAKGIAVYIFDFCGGSIRSKSDGKTTQMSVMTEVSDLETILNEAKNWNFVNPDKIILLGASQGGVASSITAARHADKIAGLILMYPAFLIHDTVHEIFPDKNIDELPETFSFLGWIDVGKNYAEDVWDYDLYSEIGKYDKRVLLMHGDKDSLVPVAYSQKAYEMYKECDFFIIKDADHGFRENSFNEAVKHIYDYLLSCL